MGVKKVLYITYDGLTDPLGQSQVLPYLLELAKHGYQFTILSFEKKERFAKEASVISSLISNTGITWVPLTFTATPPLLSKIYDRYQIRKTALKLHRRNSFDIVHCRSYVAAEVGLKLKNRFGVRFLFDMRGFWADEKVDNGQWDLSKPFFKRVYQHYKQKEKEFLLNADAIVSLTEVGKDYLVAQPYYQKLPIHVIPCCADLEHFDFNKISETETERLRQQIGIPEQAKVVTYLGSLGGWYLSKEMFVFFSLLLQKDPNYFMLMLTKEDASSIKKEARSFGIAENKIHITYSTRSNLPLYLSLSSFSIFFIKNSFSKIASSPTKHAELMGMGIPVICNDIGDTGHVINSTRTGIIINNFDEASMLEAIQHIHQFTTITPSSIREAARKIFDLRTGAALYRDIYTTLTN